MKRSTTSDLKQKNINGLNKDGVYGAHEMSAFIKAFFPQKNFQLHS